MSKPCIKADYIDGALVIADEFVMGSWNEQPIAWRILDIEDDCALAISVEAVAQRVFDENAEGSTWEASSLRTWLNGEFLAGAFEGQQEAFVPSVLVNSATESFGQEPEPDTTDTLFIMSCKEVEKYLPLAQTRTIDGEHGAWWLRTPGYTYENAVTVQQDGWLNEYGYAVTSDYVSVRPAVRIDLNKVEFLLPDGTQGAQDVSSAMRASEYGEELMLEVMEEEDLSLAVDFMEWFGVDQSWESYLVDELVDVAELGDAAAIDSLLEITGGIENPGLALAVALSQGNQSAARTLIRHGVTLDGRFAPVALVNDTPGMAKDRKEQYAAQNGNLYQRVLEGRKAELTLRELISQDILRGQDLRGILIEAARDEDHKSLFAWIMNPDNNPIPGLGARWIKRHIAIAKKSPKSDVPVSAEGLQLFWHPELMKKDPETVRYMAPYLTNPQMEGKRELICFMAQQGWTAELRALLNGRKVFTPKMIHAAFEESRKAKKRETTAMLADFLRSIGAGKLLETPKQDEE